VVAAARSYLRNADLVLARLIDDRPDFDLAEARLDNPFGPVLRVDLFGAPLFQITRAAHRDSGIGLWTVQACLRPGCTRAKTAT
jgi:hypothetical protein